MRVAPFAEMMEGPLARPRFTALLIGVFGVAALLLSAVGLYGVMATLVRQRYREIGVRLAVGATASDMLRLVLGDGLRLAGAGIVVGLVATVAATRALRSLLFGVHPLDPITLLCTVLALGGVAILASYLPARRAAAVDPVMLLRTE